MNDGYVEDQYTYTFYEARTYANYLHEERKTKQLVKKEQLGKYCFPTKEATMLLFHRRTSAMTTRLIR